MFLKAKNIAAIILGLACFALSYLESNSRNPNSREDRIVPRAVKGIDVHISETQPDLLSWPISIVIGSGLINAVVILIHGEYS
jgi:hypothetical protein